MSQTVAVGEMNVNGRNLSVTTRDNGDSQAIMEELTYRTIKAWVMIVTKFLDQQVYTLPLDEHGNVRGSVESAYAYELNTRSDTDQPDKPLFAFAETFGDARVTVWDTYRSNPRISFRLCSDDIPQVAVDTWLANQRGMQKAFEEFGGIKERVQNAAQSQHSASNSSAASAAPTDRPATPKSQNFASSEGKYFNGTFYTKNEAIEKLQPGDMFNMKIAQIACVSDKKGQRQYEFSAKYGPNIGKFPEITIYADNEVAVESGLIADLDKLGLQLGQHKDGSWILQCNVGKPVTKGDKTYGRVYPKTLVPA